MKWISFIVVSICMASLCACSIAMVNQHPDQKDLSVLRVGTQRDAVHNKLGRPAYTGTDRMGTYDAYVICQGKYSNGEKAAREFYYVVADLFTLCLWEIVGTPVEKAASGYLVRVWVIYGSDEKIVKLENLDLRGSLPSGRSLEAATGQNDEKPKKLWIPPHSLYCN